MCKRFVYLISLVFLVALVSAGPAVAADPSLQLWLRLDGNADDSSNYARHGTENGTIAYVPGVFDQALELTQGDTAGGANEDYISVDWSGILGPNAFSIALWIKTADNSQIIGWGSRAANGQRVEFRTINGRVQLNCGGGNVQSQSTTITDSQWHHVAVTAQAGAPQDSDFVKIYVDGQDNTQTKQDAAPIISPVADQNVKIGVRQDLSGRWLTALLDDIRVYDRVLTPAEVAALATTPEPTLVSPADGTALDDVSVLLEWTSGAFAADVNGHQVYLADNFEDVNSNAPAALVAVTSNLFHFASGLSLGTTYYWQIVDVNAAEPGSPWKSEIWSFDVPDVTTWRPSPADGAQFVSLNPTLSWKLGLGGALSDVYFGTSFEDVNSATSGPRIPGTTYTPPGPLANDTTYYWRIDTVKGDMTVVTGPVWSFKTEPFIPIDDPNLLGWWKLDGIDPSRAIDWSGHANHGYPRGDPEWVAGHDGGAMEFDGADRIAISGLHYNSTGLREVTVAAWVRTVLPDDQAIASFDRNSYWRFEINGNGGGEGQIGWSVWTDAAGNEQLDIGSTTRVDDGEWHHVAGAFDNGVAAIYVDGAQEAQATRGTSFGSGITRYGFIASRSEAGTFDGNTGNAVTFQGAIDDVRIYDRALSAGQVEHLMDPRKAWGPAPASGARDVPLGTKLTWNPGTDPDTGLPYTKHDVYFSTSFEDVNTGTVPAATLEGINEYTPALEYYNNYYWRVDGVNAAGEPYRGNIWSFKATYDPAQVVDPNLLAWYKLDGDATDSSGYGRDCQTFGAPTYGDGVDGQGIELGAFDDYLVYSFPEESRGDFTITAWAKADTVELATFSSVFSNHRPNTAGLQIDVNDVSQTYRINHNGDNATFGPVITGWVHLAVTGQAGYLTLYYNGRPVANTLAADTLWNQYAIGINRNVGDNRFDGTVDEVRVYDYALDAGKIELVMRIDPAKAWNPNPGDGTTGVGVEPVLSWTPGDGAVSHTVSLGADDPANLAVLPDQPQAANSVAIGPLDLGRTYYWAVDETDAASEVTPGRIWQFTTGDYLTLDDMESYNLDPLAPASADWIFYVWVDGLGDYDCLGVGGNGSGANVYAQSALVLGGSEAMRFDYDNDGDVEIPCNPGTTGPRALKYSMAEAQVAKLPSGIGSDWTASGIKALSIPFFGDTLNDIEPMWVKLTDATGGSARVGYGTYAGEDPCHITEAQWHQWNVDLQEFADAGVDLTNVKSIAIGIGDPDSMVNGGSGIVYFDEIRLYTSTCVLLRRSPQFAALDFAPEGDPGGDCVIDYRELAVMTRDWLLGDATVEPLEPNAATLMVRYEFENDANDSSPNGRNGTEYGLPAYVAGHAGMAISLDGVDDYVSIDGYKGVTGTNPFTITAWIKTFLQGGAEVTVASWGSTGGGSRVEFRVEDDRMWMACGAGNVQGRTAITDGEWHHVAAVVHANAEASYPDVIVYVDGTDDTIPSVDPEGDRFHPGSVFDVGVGWRSTHSDRFFPGQIDDFRIYSDALSHAQVISVGGFGTLYLPVASPANISDDEPVNAKKVNFLDYALLMQHWLQEEFWP